MKKYNFPICEIEILTASDVITTSVSTFREFSFSNTGNLDSDGNIDRIMWMESH